MESALERREQIAERLRLRRRDNVKNLAAEFGVTERTIRYDILTLSMSYPIETARGCGGGVIWTGKRPEQVYTEREIKALQNAIKAVSLEDALVLEKLLSVHSVHKPFDVEVLFNILLKGITQTELAQRLGISKSALANIIAGRRTPGTDLQMRILEFSREVSRMNEGSKSG